MKDNDSKNIYFQNEIIFNMKYTVQMHALHTINELNSVMREDATMLLLLGSRILKSKYINDNFHE